MTCGRLPYNDKSLKHLIEQTKKKVVFPEKLNLSSGKRARSSGVLSQWYVLNLYNERYFRAP
jgi:hypothetical protein